VQSVVYDMTTTKGCTCKQIAEELGVGKGQIKKGCSPGMMQKFTDISAEPDRPTSGKGGKGKKSKATGAVIYNTPSSSSNGAIWILLLAILGLAALVGITHLKPKK